MCVLGGGGGLERGPRHAPSLPARPHRSGPPSLSDCLSRLTLLRELNLSTASLPTADAPVPASLSALTALTRLSLACLCPHVDLRHSDWDAQLACLSRMLHLAELDLSDNKLDRLPAPVAELTSLHTVRVCFVCVFCEVGGVVVCV